MVYRLINFDFLGDVDGFEDLEEHGGGLIGFGELSPGSMASSDVLAELQLCAAALHLHEEEEERERGGGRGKTGRPCRLHSGAPGCTSCSSAGRSSASPWRHSA